MSLKIPIYEWDLVIYRMTPDSKNHKVPDKLKSELSDEMLADLQKAIDTNGLFGRCYWNAFNRMLRVVVCADDLIGGDYADRFAHEINHAIDKVMEVSEIIDTEARSYLTGWMYRNFREKGFI